MALPFTLKKDLKAKEELCKLKYFTMPKYNLQKILSKRNQNLVYSQTWLNHLVDDRHFIYITKLKKETLVGIHC
jgi:hypothetical protein